MDKALKKVYKGTSFPRSSKTDAWTKYWLEWQVALSKDEEDSLISSSFNLVEKEMLLSDFQKVSVPLLALHDLAEKYSWLQVLRNPQHRADDPYELVRFINTLEARTL